MADNSTSMVNIQMAKYNKIEPIERETSKGWAEYGEGNIFPQYILDLYANSSVHGSIVNSIAFMIAGKGFQSLNQAVTKQIESSSQEFSRSVLFGVLVGRGGRAHGHLAPTWWCALPHHHEF
jgi:hypothetical protein